jgi:glycyl-tRNA synthetase (class II)
MSSSPPLGLDASCTCSLNSFWTREDDEQKGVRYCLPYMHSYIYVCLTHQPTKVLSLPILVAPIKVLIVPLSAKEELQPLVQEVFKCNFDCGVPQSLML